ncbi:hypothetical protein XM38_015170 [Halomicronema hongdechloris C2206]|uniref:Uncharacterized protein n=1 Tax=Halomicronema hongdechloris C2206 TaxID=1641165 RepID=A0A1Z3HKF9_9CYAN|nr:hypothetical protein [Halomicronema hongdechloris]ASC70577.1 hypothetical protein XM38_015170 [Halomicronema hongdechloris C2206]
MAPLNRRTSDPDRHDTLERLTLLLYLVPIFGVVPALGRLWLGRGSRRERSTSRLVVVLAMGWFLAYVLLSGGAQLSPALSLRLLVTSTLISTGYFITNLWLMVRLLRGKSVQLPGISQLSDRIL